MKKDRLLEAHLVWELYLAVANTIHYFGWEKGSRLVSDTLTKQTEKDAVNMAVQMWRDG